ncbi:uracil-DNA glycosylase [Legionella feeleii]|uniref:Uracil-DNA glycosylase n=1 Tax=Legionella feeleii TaxID=453 RepID=A0A378IU88_9GAMM|nr:uracil-DNA glycosylase [Legionella feeleii]
MYNADFVGEIVYFLLEKIHPQWQRIVAQALEQVDKDYLLQLQNSSHWLPGIHTLFAAFSLPLCDTKYILLGESPYPRPESANGYAFWDNSVHNLWSQTGLSKEVNRATSLRNWIKMLLVARGDLQQDRSQAAIARLDKSHYWQTAEHFFISMINKGFLLLNASLVYSEDKVRFHAKHWRPFMHSLLTQLAQYNQSLQLILFGRIAEEIPEASFFSCLIAEHPYNLSFISNPMVLDFFKPLDLLSCHE